MSLPYNTRRFTGAGCRDSTQPDGKTISFFIARFIAPGGMGLFESAEYPGGGPCGRRRQGDGELPICLWSENVARGVSQRFQVKIIYKPVSTALCYM